MTRIVHPAQALLTSLSGFRVEFSEVSARVDIVLDRPPFNVVTMEQREQLRLVFEALDDDPQIRVIVLRSVGEHFSMGGDIVGLGGISAEDISNLAWNVSAPARCSKPVIAANRGYCFGVGFELSLACDFRLATETTMYALSEQRIGQLPGSGGSARLQKMVGIGRTKDIIMRSRQISGPQAFDWGIVTEFVPDSDLESATDDMVRELLAFSPLAQRAAKRLLNDIDDSSLSMGIEMEGHINGRLHNSDYREGFEAL
ncbi:enoyl-CoA hydratase/isomerase family protein [Paraburkholderia acidisoli]|uniref:Enoyl-CoA hydratase/isomerase family protein n=1 Tax=Paraburkholderia acidisoli TaxID=2571748 RepID=A0A7Z2GJU7_9BURK|nr:enoyl-CoA hydratase/isomerase family protein [Paraburkholderia acidisoli]QGZ63106.1 enoyl-CoA hydratase/isomerase family protein [Paraburkholderia acidisoli]